VGLSEVGIAGALTQVVLPALGCGVVGGLLFCPSALALRQQLAEATQQVLRDDLTQFTQNAFTVAGLLFALLLSDTLGFLLQRQERLYKAVFREVSEARALVEQLGLLGAARGGGARLGDVGRYLAADLRRLGRPRVLPAGGGVDPLERLLFATSVGAPAGVCGSARAVRQARAERLAAVQRRFPAGHLVILGVLAVLMLGFFVLLGAGVAGFEPGGEAARPGHLLWLLAWLFGLLVAAVALCNCWQPQIKNIAAEVANIHRENIQAIH